MPARPAVHRALALALLLAPPAFAQDLSLESRPTRWRISLERFEASDENTLTLAGVHYDLLEVWPDVVPGLYAGIGGYGAVTGTTGGLFFGGLTVGWLREMYPGWNLDVGVLAGGGGGGGADTGGGLVLRPHVAFERVIGLAALRLELARPDFPTGDIEDLHLALGVSLPGELLQADVGRQPGRIPDDQLLWRRMRIAPTALSIFPDDGTELETGVEQDDPIHTAGVEIDYFLNDRWYLPFELYGATGGGVGGFRLALTGIGATWPTTRTLALETKLQVGAGGGGDVDTGGGYLLGAQAGASWSMTRHVALQLAGGYLTAPDGDLDGFTGALGVAWNPRAAELAWTYDRSRLDREGIPGSVAALDGVRLQLLHKSYFPASSAQQKSGGDAADAIHLIGVGVQKPIEILHEDFAATFEGSTAWDGKDAGGYVEGFAGLQYELSPFANARFHTVTLHAEVGAGGGGDVDVRSGLMYAIGAGWRFQYSRDLALSLDIGSFEADRGTFHGESFTVGLSYVLDRALLR